MKVSAFLLTTMLASCAVTMAQDSVAIKTGDTLAGKKIPKKKGVVMDSIAPQKKDSLDQKNTKRPKTIKGDKKPSETDVYFNCPPCGRG